VAKIDGIKARIDWLKELFKVVVTVMVADVAGMSKLYLDNMIGVLFYMGGFLLPVLLYVCINISKKIERHFNELEEL
jgi:hypothetical protein